MTEEAAPAPPLDRRDLTVAAVLAAIAALFRLPRLGFPAEEIFDEVYHAVTAQQYLNGTAPTEWVHPPTAKLLIAIPIWLFGYKSWAWRLAPALAGIALAPVFYAFARRVLPTRRAAVIASALLLCDGVYLVQSRTAMTNIFAVLFQVGSALFVLRSVLREKLPVGEMSLAGLFLGLALSTRWTSLWAWGYLGLVLLAVRQRRFLRPRELGLTALAFGVIPVLIYALSYMPLMAQDTRGYMSADGAHREGHTFTTAAGLRDVGKDLVQEQINVWGYHANLRATHPYFTKWWTWPWLYRPTWYYFNQDKEEDGKVRGIVAIGNPALWWASVPVCLFVLGAGLVRRDPRWVFAGLGFFMMWLPWGISPRQLNYSHYLFEAIPYACLSLALLLDPAWDDARLRWVARGYVGLTVVMFLYFLPFLTAIPVPIKWFYWQAWDNGPRPWTWFPKWV